MWYEMASFLCAPASQILAVSFARKFITFALFDFSRRPRFSEIW